MPYNVKMVRVTGWAFPDMHALQRGTPAKNCGHLRRGGSHLEPFSGDPMEALGTSPAKILIEDFDCCSRVKTVLFLHLVEQCPGHKGKIANRSLYAL